MNCRDVHCENPKHIEDIDNYAFSIMKSMDESIKMTALKNVKNKKKSKIIPGWNDLVKPYKGVGTILACNMEFCWQTNKQHTA